MILTGEKTSLRALSEDDCEQIYIWRNQSELRKNIMLHPFPVSPGLEKQWLINLTNNTSNEKVYFGIIEKTSRKFIGYTLLNQINWVNRNCFFGILIGEQDFRGRGIGTEVTKLVLQFALNHLNLHKVYLYVLAENTAAINVYQKLSFQKEGLLKEHFFWGGQWMDVLLMSRIAS